MKTLPLLAASVCLALTGLLAPMGLCQGDLVPPPGPPAPTMKRLDQVEPRIIVNAANTPGDAANTFIINAPGAYYITGNLTGAAGKHGISIRANDVSLDLNGFALIGPGGGTLRGIDVPATQVGFGIRNGSVRGWTAGGLRAEKVRAVHAEKVRLVGNTGGAGIYVGLGSLIRECVANANADGFRAEERCHILQCVSTQNGGNGFEATSYVTLTDCTASQNSGPGFKVESACAILRCSATGNTGYGIEAANGCTITDSAATENTLGGIFTSESAVTQCAASTNGGVGIQNSEGSVVNSNASHNTQHGILVDLVRGCTTSHNLKIGISAEGGTVAGCTTRDNGNEGISARYGSITNSTAIANKWSGISCLQGSVTNSTARSNGDHGINATNGVITACRALNNNTNNSGSVNILDTGAATSGNNANN